MEYLQALSLGLDIIGIAAQIMLLVLQLSAYFRHRHPGFLLLAFATVSGLLYLALTDIAAELPAGRSSLGILSIAGAILFLLQITFGIWGTVAIFRSYRVLTDAARANVMTRSAT